ncbi:MAG TPA: hypothetical protein VGI39_39680 [Polyangiaceae bacterium]|jgi:hypothetical protein
MAFVEADRVQIRKYLGFASIYLTQDPRLESAITALQSQADHGTQPTSDAETEVKALLYGAPAGTASNGAVLPPRNGLTWIAYQIEQKMVAQQGAGAVASLRLDSARNVGLLRSIGRQLVHQLSTMLDTVPRRDVFGPADMTDDGGGHARRSPY